MPSSPPYQETNSPSRRVVVVVGPGRSGTSALTRGLGALGVELGDNLKRATRKNARGFFEDQALLAINYQLHAQVGLRKNGSSVRLLGAEDWQRVDLEPLRKQAIDLIQRRFGQSPLWGFKCGGVMRLLPFWEEVLTTLGLEISYVMAVRNPLSVARSRSQLDYYRGFQEKTDLEWLVQVVPYLRRMLSHPFTIVDYDRLMASPEEQLGRIAHMLKIPLTAAMEKRVHAYRKEFLSEDLRHNRASLEALYQDQRVNALTRDAYTWLYRLATDEMSGHSADFSGEWARIEAALELMAPVLRHLDRLEDELRSRRLVGLDALWKTLRQRFTQSVNATSVKNPNLGGPSS